MISLNKLIVFKNQHLLERYQKDYSDNQLSSEAALKELLKYLWLCQKHQEDKAKNPHDESLHFVCVMYPEMHEIDDMWHTFLLFTYEYAEFCKEYFGKFLHHIPNTGDEDIDFDQYETQLNRYLSYVYDNLGEETLKEWFAEYLNEVA